MRNINIEGIGVALVLASPVWIAAGWVLNSTPIMLAALLCGTVGLVLITATPDTGDEDDDMALGPDELEASDE